MKNRLFLTSLLILSLVSCSDSGQEKSNSTASNQPFDPVGRWEYKVTTDVSYGVINIVKSNDSYQASMTTEVFGTLDLMNLEIKGTKLTADLDVDGTPAKIKVDFDGNKMTGEVATADDKFPMIGERAKD